MNFTKKLNLHNRFDIEVKDAKTGEIRQKAYAENIILNQAWAQILSNIDWFDKIYFGTGTGTISATRTALFDPLSSKTATGSVWSEDITNNYFSHRQSISILENEHVGSTLTEVGVGTSTVLCTHAMLKDMNGNPVSIVKTDTDIIVIYGTIYAASSTVSGDMTGIDIARIGVQNNHLLSTILGRRTIGSTNGYAFQLSANMADTTYDKGDYSSGTYTAADIDVQNKKVTFYHRIPAASANTGGLKSYVLSNSHLWAFNTYRKQPSIIGRLNTSTITQSTITEQIGTGNGVLTDFSTTFPFVKSGTCVIKVDGVVANPTVYYGIPNKKDVTGFLRNRTNAEQPDRCAFGLAGYLDFTQITTPEIIENPFFGVYGLTSVTGYRFKLESSDDMTTWTEAAKNESNTSATVSIPIGHQKKRYYRISCTAVGYCEVTKIESSDMDDYKNVRFATPPANGAVITAEYQCDCAAKDVYHVVDVTVVIQLGEYTP